MAVSSSNSTVQKATPMARAFTADLRHALELPADQPLAFLANFEAELAWGEGLTGLPTSSLSFENDAVRRMEQFALWLAGPQDTVLLGQPLDPDYEDYLRTAGLVTCKIVAPASWETQDDTLTRLLADPLTAKELRTLADNNVPVIPMGTTHTMTEQLQSVGLAPAAPSAGIYVAVNSKIYSAQVCKNHNIRRPVDRSAQNLEELEDAIEAMNSLGRPYVVKESLGVSGRGLYVVKNAKRGSSLLRMMKKSLSDGQPCAFVLEEWIDKATDLNYQLLLHKDGSHSFHGLREAIVTKGVHQGHITPSQISKNYDTQIAEACEQIAVALHADGFYGTVGVDALWNEEVGLYPCLEINARLNMSTFQNNIVNQFGQQATIMFSKVDTPVGQHVHFKDLLDKLGSHLFDAETQRGVLVMNFATAQHGSLEHSPGRIYFGLFAANRDQVLGLHEHVTEITNNIAGESA